MPTPKDITSKINVPMCQYSIRGNLNSEIISARVGDVVEHEWTCRNGGVPGKANTLILSKSQ